VRGWKRNEGRREERKKKERKENKFRLFTPSV
jgi:hypothetical protein